MGSWAPPMSYIIEETSVSIVTVSINFFIRFLFFSSPVPSVLSHENDLDDRPKRTKQNTQIDKLITITETIHRFCPFLLR